MSLCRLYVLEQDTLVCKTVLLTGINVLWLSPETSQVGTGTPNCYYTELNLFSKFLFKFPLVSIQHNISLLCATQ